MFCILEGFHSYVACSPEVQTVNFLTSSFHYHFVGISVAGLVVLASTESAVLQNDMGLHICNNLVFIWTFLKSEASSSLSSFNP
jgi:K+ transporter